MKHVTIGDFLTEAEIERAQELWLELKDTGTFAATLERLVIGPQMARINAALGQENNARYLAYMVEHVFHQAAVETADPKTTKH